MESTEFLWPRSTACLIHADVSQRRTVPSRPPQASSFPLSFIARVKTAPLCASRACVILPFSASHNRRVRSLPAETSRLSLKITRFTVPWPVTKVRTLPPARLWMASESLIPPEMIRTLVTVLPKGTLATVPDCGHSIYFEQPQVFNQLVRDFLGQSLK